MKQDWFAKNYRNPQLARAEFERTLDVYDKVAEAKPLRLRIAKPMKVNNSTAYFERITDCINLRKLICNIRVDTEVLYYTGQALAELHSALNPQINCLDENISIHGDFSATNVLYMPSKNLIYIVDFAPYRYDNSESYSYAPAYRDLAHLVLTLEIKYPIYKIHLVARKKNREMSAMFWEGYENVIGRKIDRDKLYEFVIKEIESTKKLFRKRHLLTRFVWTKVFDRTMQRYINLKES